MFRQALIDIVRRLDEARKKKLVQSYALVGGFAVSAWGVARATQDIDLAVALGTADPARLAAHLKAGFQPGDPDDPLCGVFRLKLSVGKRTVPVQLILLQSRWADLVFGQIKKIPVLERRLPVVDWPALVLLKLYAGGPVDLQDARNIVAVRRPNQSELKDLAAKAEELGVAEEYKALFAADENG
ncbi:MAG: hypothetical protein A3H49_02375 [Nitrospirae bacterium RIFCSPLOWO2_02_FULL_62_14]|nr:MAG: hypothetical protein A3H49_02375 [Nitrospirae bacterium RIFCSPLOWO2_02_FULL_62_14]OGW67037.1 MAG: hypothetical protein A3A88_03270 [Nitrospirae bacterium RIFCSPLOWO2_01_FULL_62_17]